MVVTKAEHGVGSLSVLRFYRFPGKDETGRVEISAMNGSQWARTGPRAS